MGWFRTRFPSPFGCTQAVSPAFRSTAVIREYGGLNNGRPCGIAGWRPLPNAAWVIVMVAPVDSSGV